MSLLIDDSPDQAVTALPKADLHVHAEASARLERIFALRRGLPLPDMRVRIRALRDEPPGMPRLLRMSRPSPEMDTLDGEPENFLARIVDLLEEEATDGAILVEVRFGRDTVLRPDFMALFREAERQVQARYPRLHAEAIIALPLGADHAYVEQLLSASIAAAEEGLAGVDFLPSPYEAEADWTPAYRWAERAGAAGLGVTAHAGEFSTANLSAALRVPGLTRIGHAVYAAREPQLMEQLMRTGVTVECPLTCNVILGATSSYDAHPIRELVDNGIPVTLATDDPVRIDTTIGREYARASALGFTIAELLNFTRNAVQASFTTENHRRGLLAEINAAALRIIAPS